MSIHANNRHVHCISSKQERLIYPTLNQHWTDRSCLLAIHIRLHVDHRHTIILSDHAYTQSYVRTYLYPLEVASRYRNPQLQVRWKLKTYKSKKYDYMYVSPSKHKTFLKHLYNVGSTSSTLDQHCTNVIQILCVYWDISCHHNTHIRLYIYSFTMQNI